MNETILIVDDSLTVRMNLAETFEAAGFRPLPCATIAEARDFLRAEPVKLVVLDVLLPDGDGVDLLKEIRASSGGADMPILMLSTEVEVKDRIRGLKTGADEYVGKPYDTEHVLARVAELLRRPASRSPHETTILVIDDSATFRDELRRAFHAAGYAVLTAGSGEEGLRLAGSRRPNAIVVDGQLPGIDGATVIRRVRLDAALRGVPCLLLTGSEDQGAELRALDAGADAFVRKDEDIDLILARLAAILRSAPSGPPSEETSSLHGSKRILAVDDSPTYLQTLALELQNEGYDVILGRSGEEALELLSVQSVDCILLDLMMPGLGGEETCRRVKAAPMMRDVPLILLTALEGREAMVLGLGAGADDYIAKSSDFEVLKARVRAQIRRKQFEDENRRIREELLHKEIEAGEARATRELSETRAALVGELERKNRELEAFSYSVSHDLRAPLRGIDGFSLALLEDHGEKLDGQGQDYLRRIRAGAQRMGELIDDMLALSRVGRADLNRSEVDLSSLAQQVAADLQMREPDRAVTFEIQAGIVQSVDRSLFRIVLENLLGNAWKFTGKVADPRISFGAGSDAGSSGRTYFVRDNGAGFDMAYVEKLFRPFQRLHSGTDFPGTGIGLATVARVVDRHGGRIWAEGAVGKGATIFFTLSEQLPARAGEVAAQLQRDHPLTPGPAIPRRGSWPTPTS
jgi:two-component system NtrC family sensor kinase